MAEFTANAVQTVALNSNVLFTDTAIKPCPCVRHREGSGIFNLRGGHTYTIFFSGNVSGEAAGAVDLAIALAGEEVPGTRMIATPAAIGDYFNVSTAVSFDVPCGCCYVLAVENVGTNVATVQNANLIITREN